MLEACPCSVLRYPAAFAPQPTGMGGTEGDRSQDPGSTTHPEPIRNPSHRGGGSRANLKAYNHRAMMQGDNKPTLTIADGETFPAQVRKNWFLADSLQPHCTLGFLHTHPCGGRCGIQPTGMGWMGLCTSGHICEGCELFIFQAAEICPELCAKLAVSQANIPAGQEMLQPPPPTLPWNRS